jgi:multimeric flavodoxin WrbA
MSAALPLVVLGSARAEGETRRAVDLAFPQGTARLMTLPDFVIGGYSYDHLNADDAFGEIADAMVASEKIVFATPVYWYAMSAPMKIFFDRMSDLTENRKAQGKALAGKSAWMIATGTDLELPEGFEVPFARTATYLSMRYRGSAYLYTGKDKDRRTHDEQALTRFGTSVVAA